MQHELRPGWRRLLDSSVRLGSLLLLLYYMAGCRPAAPVAAPAAAERDSAASAPVTRIQTHPLYRQAEQAFHKQQYSAALRLLDKLAALPDFSSAERAFLERQRQICLHPSDPVPVLTPVSASVSHT